MRAILHIFVFYFFKAECILWYNRRVIIPKDYALTVQNVLTNEYLYPYSQLYDQQSNEYYKDPYSVQNLRNKNMEPPQPETTPIKVQYDAVVHEVHTKYLNNPKQIYKKDRFKSLDNTMQKFKLTIGDPKTRKKKKISFNGTVKTYNKYKSGELNDNKPNAYIEKLMEIYLDPRTSKIYKKIYEEIISAYYRNRDLRTYNNVNILKDDVNNKFHSEIYNYNLDSEEYESEKDLNDYCRDMLSKRNPRRFVKGLKAWFSKINNSSTNTLAPLISPLSQVPQISDTSKQLLIATTTELQFTKETDTLKNITDHMSIDKKGHIRFKRNLNSEKNDAKESTVTNSTDYGRTDGKKEKMEQIRSSPVKIRIIGYIDEKLTELKKKIQPVAKLREIFLKNFLFAGGYVTANVETLAVRIKKLKAELDDNKDSWDERSIMNFFDKVITIHKVLNYFLPMPLDPNDRKIGTKTKQTELQKELYLIGLPEAPTSYRVLL